MSRVRARSLPASGGLMDRRARRALRQECDQHISTLDLRAPFDVGRVCASLADRRGRPIRLQSMALPAGGPGGLLLATPQGDVICYDRAVTGLHRDHIILHEIGHLLFGHQDAPAVDAETSQLLMPGLDPALVRRVLGRTRYGEAAEFAAETFATLALARVAAQHGRRWGGQRSGGRSGRAEPLSRIERSLAPPD